MNCGVLISKIFMKIFNSKETKLREILERRTPSTRYCSFYVIKPPETLKNDGIEFITRDECILNERESV